jgi:N-acetylmuramoyl-L-alanine amidase
MKKWILRVSVVCLAAMLSSCVSAPRPKPDSPAGSPSVSPGVARGPIVASAPASTSSVRRTIQHIVGPGETLWRIAKMYDVPMANIMSANSIRNSQGLRMGQRLRVPNAAEIQPVVALYPSHKWKYIIIHHSATDEGSSLAFHHSHLAKGWDKGVGYHFVIDNRSGGKQDGAIEATPRWIKQLDGAHCKASDMNMKGIGICLVGNFDSEQVSAKQMASLVYLVNTLQKYYKIPNKNIMAHGHVDGSSTNCPGKKFPWTRFKSRIAN